jgi:2-polyprenyl-3-methyl-5-hydroxy-6-metoxy-1,4-benzoquinol methylase
MATVETFSEQPRAALGAREEGTYVVPNDWDDARQRLRLLETWADPGTTQRLDATAVAPGWRCLEAGAGGGSVTRWLCERVGPAGRVVAIDMDTRFVEDLDYPQLEVRRQDVVTQPVPRGEFDLVHTRALLTHLPARAEVLADLIAALRPGGWLVIEEIDFFPIHACGRGVYREVLTSMETILAPAGLNCHWARQLPSLLHSSGLEAVSADAQVQFCNGGSAAAQFLAVSIRQLRDALEAGGCAAQDLDRCSALFDDPTTWLPNMAIVGVAGRRPR